MADRAAGAKSGGIKPDISSILGILIALGGILGGLVLEGGKIAELAQLTSALIVLGGTLGAVMITTPLTTLVSAAKKLRMVFFEATHSPSQTIEEIITYASKARRNSIVSLETDLDNIADPFLRKALTLAVDGTDLNALRSMMELDIALDEKAAEAEAKVYESAGGYAPTIGIIGAVLGLIQVMKHLENIDEVGRGIAVAFVATVYGVGAANLFFLPAGNKLKARSHQVLHLQELMLEGVCSIVEGLNPKLIRVKLENFAPAAAKEAAAESQKGAAQAALAAKG
ncbi:MAG: flagellar motor protein [Bryobacteraceae bacterium]|jgi:chemotaxis protein MotA